MAAAAAVEVPRPILRVSRGNSNVNRTGPSACRPGPNESPSGSSPSPPDTSGSQSDPSVSQSDLSESRSDPSVSQSDPNISQSDPNVSQSDPSVSQSDPSVSHSDPSVSLPAPSVGRPDPSESRSDPSLSRPDPSERRPGPSVDCPGQNVSQPSPSVSLPTPNESQPETSEIRPQPSESRPELSENLRGSSGSRTDSIESPGSIESQPDKNESRPGSNGSQPDKYSRPCPSGSQPDPNKNRLSPSVSRPDPRVIRRSRSVSRPGRSESRGGASVSRPVSSVGRPDQRASGAPSSPEPPIHKGCHMVHWFRKGLRLHDNRALLEGLRGADTFRCVFLLDPWFATSSNVGINKWRFLLQCLEDLDSSLKKLNSRLFVVRGQPADVLPKLFKKWGTTLLTFEEDPEPFGRIRDYNVVAKCRDANITVLSRVSHTLYKLDKIIERNGGKAPLTYHQFQALIASMPPPPRPVAAPEMRDLFGVSTPIDNNHDEIYGVPTLEELGFETAGLADPVWVGGESEGLARLERHLERKAWVASFGRPKMTPQALRASPTGLSPYLRFGCLSTRLFYYQLTDLYVRVKREQPPLSLHGQILWREFFYCAATRNPKFDRMEGNPICVQIPWQKDQEALEKWAQGRTGFPWIDAIMIQLRQEGWIHHISHHAAACFLTRGDLWISWEEGMKVFDEFLLDGDWSMNAGMWMWLSCSSFFQQFFHCYCPVRFGRKNDPNGDFVRHYIPALASMPARYVHAPWLAPEHVQRAARCVVGQDYPLPCVDHDQLAHHNMERIKQVYVQLAKFQPQTRSSLNLAAQRPNVIITSPSPTSIIQSINHSNYLCSQQTVKPLAEFETPSSGVNAKVPEFRHPIQLLAVPKRSFKNMNSTSNGEQNSKRKGHSKSKKSTQKDVENRDVNNYIPDDTKTLHKDVFMQPMYYVPYDASKLGLTDNDNSKPKAIIISQQVLQPPNTNQTPTPTDRDIANTQQETTEVYYVMINEPSHNNCETSVDNNGNINC